MVFCDIIFSQPNFISIFWSRPNKQKNPHCWSIYLTIYWTIYYSIYSTIYSTIYWSVWFKPSTWQHLKFPWNFPWTILWPRAQGSWDVVMMMVWIILTSLTKCQSNICYIPVPVHSIYKTGIFFKLVSLIQTINMTTYTISLELSFDNSLPKDHILDHILILD